MGRLTDSRHTMSVTPDTARVYVGVCVCVEVAAPDIITQRGPGGHVGISSGWRPLKRRLALLTLVYGRCQDTIVMYNKYIKSFWEGGLIRQS